MRFLFPVLSGVLLVGVGLIVAGELSVPEPTFTAKLANVVPSAEEVPGWTVTEQPIADTPEMQEAVGELLNFDDAVFAIYTQGERRISVYAAYWTPGRMSHRLVAGHTPDVCWVGGGWKPLAADRRAVNLVDGRESQPAEWRTFELQGQTEYVAFWHLVGGQSKSYGTQAIPPWWASLADLWDKGLKQREEQLFVRISSNGPLESAWDTPVIQKTLAAIPGLAAPRETVPQS